MDQNCDLYFPLPEQKDADRGEIKIVQNIFHSTLNDLPFGNQEKAAREIFDVLYKSNKIKFKDTDRLALLREIEGLAPQVIDGLRQKIKNVTVPVGRREEKVAKILVAIHYELALAYRCLLADQPAVGLTSSSVNQAYADAVRLTIYHLGEILRTKYSVFANPSGTIWKYVYTLFICANKLNIDDDKLPSSKWCRFDTVEGVFKSVLLMSLSSPLTMRGKEFNALYELAPELAKYISLGQIDCGDEYPDLTTFNLSGTESPKKQFATGCDSCGNASNCFAVSTSALVKYIEEQQAQIKPGGQLSPLQKLLSNESHYKKLKRNLSDSEAVDHGKRVKGDGIVELVAGFSDVCTFLGKKSEEHDVGDGETIDAWTTIGDEDVVVEEIVDWTATGIIRAGIRKTNSQIINHSNGGYCLYIDAEEKFRLQVGELVAVKESDKGDWRLAVVTWVSGKRSRMDFGVNLLDGAISTGTVTPLNVHAVNSTIECLFLNTGNDDDANSVRVITAANSFKSGDRFLVDYHGEEQQVAVTGINSKTEGYVEYICDWSVSQEVVAVAEEETSEEAVPEEAAPKGVQSTSPDFESIWDEL